MVDWDTAFLMVVFFAGGLLGWFAATGSRRKELDLPTYFGDTDEEDEEDDDDDDGPYVTLTFEAVQAINKRLRDALMAGTMMNDEALYNTFAKAAEDVETMLEECEIDEDDDDGWEPSGPMTVEEQEAHDKMIDDIMGEVEKAHDDMAAGMTEEEAIAKMIATRKRKP